MPRIKVRVFSGEYRLDEDQAWRCIHTDAHINRACCPPGTEDCGCKGRNSITCENINCTGITDDDMHELMLRLNGVTY